MSVTHFSRSIQIMCSNHVIENGYGRIRRKKMLALSRILMSILPFLVIAHLINYIGQ